jgi:hypothetical protein
MISKSKKGADPRYDNTPWIINSKGNLYVQILKDGKQVLSDVGPINAKMSYSKKGSVEGRDNVAIIRVSVGRLIFTLSLDKLMTHTECFPDLRGALAAGKEPKQLAGKFSFL